jgi:pimeloyl-ACP methyl ester carboxylesterase
MKNRLLAGGVVATILCIAMPSSAAPPSASAPEAKHTDYTIDWSDCPGTTRVQCGTLQVPVDWSKPKGARIGVAVARRTADDPGRRIGTLFFNPGGPGDGGVDYIVNAESIFSATLRARFDLVGADPRGMRHNAQVRCGIAGLTPTTTLFPRTRQQFEELRRHNRAFGESCLALDPVLTRNMDTISVARDHEALRIALGVRQISWFGISYGTQLAINYAELFPRRTRAMLMDAALEHTGSEVTMQAEEIITVENSFNRFAAWCDTAPTCALRGQDVGAVYDRLVADADRNPIPVPGALRPVTGEDIRMGTPSRLTFKEPSIYGPDVSWAGLSRALAAAIAGDASAFAVPVLEPPTSDFNSITANGCGDYVSEVQTYDEMRQRIQLGRQLAPHLQGASELWRVMGCSGWPIRAANPPRRLHVRGVPTLIVNATFDPSTSYKWAYGLSAQIEGSDILTRVGDGHTSYYTSACARAAMDRFLIQRSAPPDAVCTS